MKGGGMSDEQAVAKHLKVFVGNLPKDVVENQVGSHFSKYGAVVNVHIAKPKANPGKRPPYGGDKPPYGFVTFKFAADADCAAVDEQYFPNSGNKLRMGYATPQTKDGSKPAENSKLEGVLDPRKVFIKGIDQNDDEEEVGDFFSQWGLVILVHRDRSQKKGGWSFIHYATKEGSLRLLEEANITFRNKRLHVNLSGSAKAVPMPDEDYAALVQRSVARHFHKKASAGVPPHMPPFPSGPPPGMHGHGSSSQSPPGGYAGGPPPGYYGGGPPPGASGMPPPSYYGSGPPPSYPGPPSNYYNGGPPPSYHGPPPGSSAAEAGYFRGGAPGGPPAIQDSRGPDGHGSSGDSADYYRGASSGAPPPQAPPGPPGHPGHPGHPGSMPPAPNDGRSGNRSSEPPPGYYRGPPNSASADPRSDPMYYRQQPRDNRPLPVEDAPPAGYYRTSGAPSAPPAPSSSSGPPPGYYRGADAANPPHGHAPPPGHGSGPPAHPGYPGSGAGPPPPGPDRSRDYYGDHGRYRPY